MNRILPLIIILVSSLHTFGNVYEIDRIPDVHTADRTRFLSNPDGIVSLTAQAEIDSLLSDIRRRSSAEVVAVIVDDIEGDDINFFATELFNAWGLGKKDNDNGILLLVAKDRRRGVIRTGYGTEGVVPDIIAGRILFDDMYPRFKEGDYDGGMIAGITRLHALTTDPDAIDELMSEIKDRDRKEVSGNDAFTAYIGFCIILTIGLLAWFLSKLYSTRGKDRFQRYTSLVSMKPIALGCTFIGLGIPIAVSLPLVIILYRLRNKPRLCPNCQHPMDKIDEVHDNDYLTPAQDLEENIGSVDYDVWLCPECGETDIYPFVNKSSAMTVCERCGARTAPPTRDRVLIRPTTAHAGQGVKEYECLNCHHITRRPYDIPKISAPVIIPIGGGGRGFGGGGGFSGGSFGGGSTGGGGASGGW